MLLLSEGDGVDDADGDAVGGVAAGKPVGHPGKETDGFHVEGFVAAFDDTDVGDVAVGVDDEAACDAPFDPLRVCVGGILTVFVDVVEECFVAAGESGFDFDVVVFEDFFVGLKTVAGDTCRDTAGLCPGVGESQDQ